MAADYDLVILGGALEGRRAAMMAADYGARVALVEPPGLFEDGQRQRFLLEGLRQLGKVRERQAVGEWFGYQTLSERLDWSALMRWSAIAAESRSAEYSVAAMSLRGVDVVLERPERLTRQMVVTTASRQLSARGVLTACGTVPAAMPLLETAALPKKVDAIGGSAISLVWAESLAAVGVDVCLVAAEILPGADEDVVRLARSRLAATGIGVSPVCREDSLVLKIDTSEPALSLPSFARTLKGNRRVRSRHPRVFACGSALSLLASERVADYLVRIAVREALFFLNARTGPFSIVEGGDRYAWVGLTEGEAVRRYGDRVQVWAASSANNADLSRVVPLPECCKLVCAGNRLVGVHLAGEGAESFAGLIAETLGQPMASFEKRGFCGEGMGGLFVECVGRSRQERWQPGQWRRDWAENWFNWRRSRG